MSDKIDQARVRHVAHLARLKLDEQEVRRFTRELSAILGYAAQLNEPDTSGVEPTSQVLPPGNVLGDDQPGLSLDPQAAGVVRAGSRTSGKCQVMSVLRGTA